MNTLAVFLSSRVKAEVLRLLFGVTVRELHVRELERQAGLSVSTVRQELKRLALVGVVVARRDGNRTCYRANTEHPLYPDIRSLVLKTAGLAEVLKGALRGLDLRAVFVFGSLAAGEEKAGSDIDLMVIGSVTLRGLAKRLTAVAPRLGREINPHILSVAELARRRKAHDHFLHTVLHAPKLFVIGDEHELGRLGC